ncbi:MAG TPA: BamA/TamA family outer membrane protein [Candidatus Eisenbacteria bacterium]|nr:BamA/TamA family outer membrane protein [Candidatus Eisenbacteria bacterium]
MLALALPAPAAGQTAGTGLPRVNSVHIEGTKLKDGQIKKVLKTQTRSWFAFWASKPLYRQDFLRSDIEIIRQFAAQHGYLDAVVSGAARPVKDENEMDVVYRVDDGPRSNVDSLAVAGVRALPKSEVDKAVTTKVGQPFNALRLITDRQALANAYSDRGYFPVITPSWVRRPGPGPDSTKTDSTHVAVRFDVVEGPSYHVRETGVEGVTDVDTNVVRRELLLQPGDPFNRDRLQRSSERLYKTTLFQFVDFKPTRIDTDSALVSFQVRVRERKHRTVEGGVGVGSADGLRLLANWSHNNLWGKNRRLRVESQVSFGTLKGFHNAVIYTEPWLFGLRVSGSAGPYFDQSQEAFKEKPFTQRRWGFSASATRELSRFATGTLGFDQQWSIAITNPDLPDSELVGFDQSQFSTSRVSASWVYDRRDDDFDPHKGELYHAVGELAGTLLGGQGQFTKGTVSAARYLPTGKGRTLAARVSLGGIAPLGEGREFTLSKVPINDLYTTGGATTVRGYQEQSILGASGTGGLMLILTNIEMRFTLNPIFGAAVFLDGGNVWSRPREFKWNDFFPGKEPIDGNDYRWGVGGGVRLRTPVGPVRFDLGYRLNDELKIDGSLRKKGVNWHLSLGQAY